MKLIVLFALSIALAISAGAQESGRRWVKMVLTRLADGNKNEVVVGPVWVRESGTADFSVSDKNVSLLVVYLSPRLTADGPMISIWLADGEDAIMRSPRPKLIAAKMDSHTDFEFGSDKFRIFVTLEVPKGARK